MTNPAQSRVPAGTPEGGRFMEQDHPDGEPLAASTSPKIAAALQAIRDYFECEIGEIEVQTRRYDQWNHTIDVIPELIRVTDTDGQLLYPYGGIRGFDIQELERGLWPDTTLDEWGTIHQDWGWTDKERAYINP